MATITQNGVRDIACDSSQHPECITTIQEGCWHTLILYDLPPDGIPFDQVFPNWEEYANQGLVQINVNYWAGDSHAHVPHAGNVYSVPPDCVFQDLIDIVADGDFDMDAFIPCTRSNENIYLYQFHVAGGAGFITFTGAKHLIYFNPLI